MTNYVAVTDEEIEGEIETKASKPQDVGADALPFNHLGGPRFEILSYLLRKAEESTTSVSVTLMKASGDRGRDLLVHSDGELIEIIQCKNLNAPMTAPDVVREILKIALHSQIDPDVLPSKADKPITISMWCTGAFTERAAELIDTWPKKWTPENVRSNFGEVVEKYKSLSGLTWAQAEPYLLGVLPKSIKLRKREAIEISAAIRKNSGIYSHFFSGTVVVPLADIREGIQDAIRSVLKENQWQQISDDDVRHMLERIGSFPPERRFYSGMGYIFGVSPQLIADMSHESRTILFESMAKPILVTKIFMEMIPEKAHKMAQAAQARMTFRNRSYPLVLSQVMTMRALGQVGRIATISFLREKKSPPELLKTDLWDLIDGLCERAWDDPTAVLSPDFVPPTSDERQEQLRKNLAAYALSGYANKDEFIGELRADCRANLDAIRTLVAEIEEYFPKDLLIAADSRSAFDQPGMLEKLANSVRAVESLMDKERAK
jgi:hypothetical protein